MSILALREMTPNHRIQPTYLPSLRYGKSAADAERYAGLTIWQVH